MLWPKPTRNCLRPPRGRDSVLTPWDGCTGGRRICKEAASIFGLLCPSRHTTEKNMPADLGGIRGTDPLAEVGQESSAVGMLGSSTTWGNCCRPRYVLACLIVALSPSHVAVAENLGTVHLWNTAALQGIRDAKLGAPMVARAVAIVHTCMYDAWAAYDDRAIGTQLGGALRRPASERTLAKQRTSYQLRRLPRS
jgi:hypothetical protein